METEEAERPTSEYPTCKWIDHLQDVSNGDDIRINGSIPRCACIWYFNTMLILNLSEWQAQTWNCAKSIVVLRKHNDNRFKFLLDKFQLEVGTLSHRRSLLLYFPSIHSWTRFPLTILILRLVHDSLSTNFGLTLYYMAQALFDEHPLEQYLRGTCLHCSQPSCGFLRWAISVTCCRGGRNIRVDARRSSWVRVWTEDVPPHILWRWHQ